MTPEQTRALRKKKDAQMANVIAVVGTLFFALCVGVFLAFVISLLRDATTVSVAHSKDLLTPMIACFGVLLAVLALMRDWNKIQIDRMENSAKILYEQAKDGLEGAFTLLEHTTQDRESWIYAARLIVQSQQLGQSIDGHSHYTTAYQIAENNVRIKLHHALNPNGSPLPAAFFFGYENWSDPHLNLEEVHNKTKPENQTHTVGPQSNTVMPPPKIHRLEERSVVVVMNFISAPESHMDPLAGINIQDHTLWPEYSGSTQGARKYISIQK